MRRQGRSPNSPKLGADSGKAGAKGAGGKKGASDKAGGSAGSSAGSMGKGNGQSGEKGGLPILFPEDWPVPVLKAMLPGQEEGVCLAENMKEAKRLTERMQGAKGALAMVCLDKLDEQDVKQQQVAISLGVKNSSGYKILVSQVWLIQLGEKEVKPRNTAEVVSIKPTEKATLVTALNIVKKEAKQDLVKALADRDNSKLIERLKESLLEQHRSTLDVFAVKDDGSCFYGLVRFAADSRDRLLRLSGETGIYIKTPKADLDRYAVAWLPGDTGRQIKLAQEVLKSHPNHRGLVMGRAGLGIRAEKDEALRMREAQGVDTTPSYLVKGLPPAMTKGELEQALKTMHWDCEVTEGGRRMAKGGATWKVQALAGPPKESFVMNCGYLRCTVYIQDLNVKVKPEDEGAKFSNQFAPPKTWLEAVQPKTQKPLQLDQLKAKQAEKEEDEEMAEEELGRGLMPGTPEASTMEEAQPDSKKRRVVARADEQQRQQEQRLANLERKQSSIDAQLAKILLLLQAQGRPQAESGVAATPPVDGAIVPLQAGGAKGSEDTMSISSTEV